MGRVTKIVDGDTIEIEGCKIRLALVDAPEIGEMGGDRAIAFLTRIIPVGTLVRVDQDNRQPFDVYGRILAVVYKDNMNVNALLIKYGVARLYDKYCSKSEFGDDPWAVRLGCGTGSQTKTITHTRTSKNCHPSYPDVCIPPPPPDLDCSDIPYRNFRVLPPDPHHFDGDKDGIGCES